MNYKLSDLLKRFIDIKKDLFRNYEEIEEKCKGNSQAMYAVIKAIEKTEKKHIEYYEKLKDELKDELNENIDFYLYDKVSKLLSEFKLYIEFPEINSIQDLIRYTVEFEKNNIGLLIDIQGRLLVKGEDVNSNIYIVLSAVIKEEQKHKEMFERLLVAKKF